MKNLTLVFIILMGMLLNACTTIPDYEWCYRYDFTTSDYSDSGASIYVGTWVDGSGVQANGYSGDTLYMQIASTFFSFESGYVRVILGTTETEEFGISLVDGTNNMIGIGWSEIAGDYTYPADSPIVTIEAVTPTLGTDVLIYAISESPNVWLREIAIYGSGENPYPENHCEIIPTPTPLPDPSVYATLIPEIEGEDGQMTRFDYVMTAADVQQSNQMTWILYSMWGMFLFWFFDKARGRKK